MYSIQLIGTATLKQTIFQITWDVEKVFQEVLIGFLNMKSKG